MTAVQGTSMMEAFGKDALLQARASDESSSSASAEVSLMGSFMSFVLPQAPAMEEASLVETPADILSLAGDEEKMVVMGDTSSIVPIKLARDIEGLSILMKEGLVFQEDIDMVQRLFQAQLQNNDPAVLETEPQPDAKLKAARFMNASEQTGESDQTKGRLAAGRSQIPTYTQFLDMNQESGIVAMQTARISVVTSGEHAHARLASIQQDTLSNERIIFNAASNAESEVASPLVLEAQAQERSSMKLVEAEKSEKNLMLLTADQQISEQLDGSFARKDAMDYGFDGADQSSHFSEGDHSGAEGFLLGKLDAFQNNFEGAGVEKVVVTERAVMGLTPSHLRVLEAIREAGVAENRRISIALAPESLGSVEISVEMSTLGQLSIFIQAEKSTTYDLLRQDASVLQQALMESGFDVHGENLHFSFGDSQNMTQEFTDGLSFQQSENEDVFHQDGEEFEGGSMTNPNYVRMKA